jgi:transcriptional regulator with XRE-family HTH domain
MTQQELADRMSLSLATIKRMESGSRPISTDELLHVGEACDFPAPFMVHGKASINGVTIADGADAGVVPACARRFADIEARLANVEGKLRRLGE